MKAYYQHELEEERTDERTGETLPAGSPAIRIVRNGDKGLLQTSYQRFSHHPVSKEQEAGYDHFMTTEHSIPEWKEKVAWLEMALKHEREVVERQHERWLSVNDGAQYWQNSADEWKLNAKEAMAGVDRARYAFSVILLYALAVTWFYITGTVPK